LKGGGATRLRQESAKEGYHGSDGMRETPARDLSKKGAHGRGRGEGGKEKTQKKKRP